MRRLIDINYSQVTRKKALLFVLFVNRLFACVKPIILQQLSLQQLPLNLIQIILITFIIMSKLKKKFAAIVAAVMNAILSLKSLKSPKNKSHFKKMSLPNLPNQSCQCLSLITLIIRCLVTFQRVILLGRALGQVNPLIHSEHSKSELSWANWTKFLYKFTSWYLS